MLITLAKCLASLVGRFRSIAWVFFNRIRQKRISIRALFKTNSGAMEYYFNWLQKTMSTYSGNCSTRCHAAAFNRTLASKPSSHRAFSVERYPLGSAML